jgi:RNA-directed DNA polymerase
MATDMKRIAELVKSNPEYKLQTLVHLINKETLLEVHKRSNKNKATGIDQITKEAYGKDLENNIGKLLVRMKNQGYQPMAVRRTYIPKIGSDKLRPLGIPAYEDKLVQGVMKQILETIYEPIFLDCSYGFRPGRSQHKALKALNENIVRTKTNYIVDVDIKGFFDNVDHDWMMKFLGERIVDNNFLRIVKRFLKAGIMEEGKYYDTEKGTPQGGIISPVLANIYLHYVIDLWFDKVVKGRCIGDSSLIRYADDVVCCFEKKIEAEHFLIALKERLKKFGLEVSEEKTKLIEFGRFARENRRKRDEKPPDTFDFLGFTHICGKSKKGKFVVKMITSKKKLKAKRSEMVEWLRRNMHNKLKDIIDKLNIKLRGHYGYYGISGNYNQINKFRFFVMDRLFWILNKRGQKRKYTWEAFNRVIIGKLPILSPKIYVKLYSI